MGAVRTRRLNEFRSGRGLAPKNSPGVGIRARMSRRVRELKEAAPGGAERGWRAQLRRVRARPHSPETG